MSQYLITGATGPDGAALDLAIADGVYVPREELGGDAVVVDASGLVALPGLVDLHVHLREPGKEDAETVLSGSRSAAKGGFTTVFAMPNTQPVADTAGVTRQVRALGQQAGFTDVRPIGAVTVGQAGTQLTELAAMNEAGVTVFSDDGHCVADPLLMRRALEYVKAFGGVVAQHSQEPRLTEGAQMNEGVVSADLGLPGWPAAAEEAIIARDVLLAEHVGSRLHVCHLSTAGSVDIVRWAKSRGVDVTAEVTPHHLMLTDELVRTFDPVYKVNPPLRTAADVRAVRAGLADGTIDIVATDHAPHTAEHKCAEWTAAAMGMVGMESALAVVREAMRDDDFGFEDVARVMSANPARIGGVEPRALGRIGTPADLVLVDPDSPHRIDPATAETLGRNNPFAGQEVSTRVQWTFYRGHPVLAEGQINGPHPERETS